MENSHHHSCILYSTDKFNRMFHAIYPREAVSEEELIFLHGSQKINWSKLSYTKRLLMRIYCLVTFQILRCSSSKYYLHKNSEIQVMIRFFREAPTLICIYIPTYYLFMYKYYKVGLAQLLYNSKNKQYVLQKNSACFSIYSFY